MDNSWMFSGEMLRAKTPEDHVMSETPEPKIKPKRVLWTTNLFFVSLVHVIAGASLMFVRPKLQTILFCLLLWQLAGIGVTMGYHRLWSHRTFEAHAALRLVLALLGTMAFQGSIKWWVLRHRLHHRFVDTDDDPHNAKKGLWYSHMGWIFEKVRYEKAMLISLDDLNRDPIVTWQHRYFVPLAFSMSFLFPTLVCWVFWNDFLGGLLYGGFVSRVIIWHAVFSINSLAHYVGSQDFSKEISARGNWVLAFLTCGEGHHNFHHEFPSDFRNGINWYDYDPTKWCIKLSSIVGLSWNLKTMPAHLIESAKHRAKSNEYVQHELATPRISMSDFHSRVNAGEQLLILNGWVLNVASYLSDHPGGADIISEFIGLDASDAFNGGLNNHSQTAKQLALNYRIAKIK